MNGCWTKLLAHPRWLFGGATAALLIAGLLFTLLGKTFMPTLDEGDLILQLEKLPSINLNNTTELDLKVQQHIPRQRFPRSSMWWQFVAALTNWAWTPWA